MGGWGERREGGEGGGASTSSLVGELGVLE